MNLEVRNSGKGNHNKEGALPKVVTPVNPGSESGAGTGVEEYPNLVGVTGFRLEFTPCLIRGRNDENPIRGILQEAQGLSFS